jgi:hypothetical protein
MRTCGRFLERTENSRGRIGKLCASFVEEFVLGRLEITWYGCELQVLGPGEALGEKYFGDPLSCPVEK